MKNKLILGALAVASISAVSSVHAFNDGDTITFLPGENSCLGDAGVYPNCDFGPGGVNVGSYFAMDYNGDGLFAVDERTAIAPGPDGGIIVGAVQPAYGSHSGCPDGSESATIDTPWCFFGNTGMHQTTVIPVTDNGDGTLDFRGWGVTWNGIQNIPLGGDPLNFPQDTGNAVVTGVGANFEIDHTAHVSLNDPSGFGGVGYTVHLADATVIVTSTPTISMTVSGGNTQECSATGGSSVAISATTTVPDGDQIDTISWTIDGAFTGNGENINPFLSLGGHQVNVTVTTVLGGSASTSQSISVNDTQAPQASAAFLDASTQQPVSTAASRDKVDIQAEATDVCDPTPAVASMVGANVTDGDRLTVIRKSGNVSLNVDALDLSVHATDSSGNSAAASSRLMITQ